MFSWFWITCTLIFLPHGNLTALYAVLASNMSIFHFFWQLSTSCCLHYFSYICKHNMDITFPNDVIDACTPLLWFHQPCTYKCFLVTQYTLVVIDCSTYGVMSFHPFQGLEESFYDFLWLITWHFVQAFSMPLQCSHWSKVTPISSNFKPVFDSSFSFSHYVVPFYGQLCLTHPRCLEEVAYLAIYEAIGLQVHQSFGHFAISGHESIM
jgi:hypothetical protein